MEEPGFVMLLLTAACSGVLAHHTFFKWFEVDTHPVIIVVSFLGAPSIVGYVLKNHTVQYAPSSQSTVYLLVGAFILSLWMSMFLYRAFFHPLAKFPGPFPAKISKLWALSQAAKTNLKWYQVDNELHQKYGDYVRTGPRELSIRDPQAILIILGFSSKTFKGPFYDSMEDSVSTTRDKVFHKQRRKVWDSSMKQLLTNYSPQLEEFTDALLKRIRTKLDKAVTINEIALHYSYDVMTQLAYGQSGGFADGSSSDIANEVLNGIQKGIDAIGLLNQVPWMMTLLTTFAGLGGPMKAFNDWSNEALEKRKKRGTRGPDLMEHLITNTKLDRRGNNLLFAESRVIIGAGSDTTATALSEIFILLAHYPSYAQKIRDEMDLIFTKSSFSCQTAYPVLESVINETLRLYPPVLFGSQRVTPREGLQIGDEWIPGDMVVYMPSWQLHHDPRNFVKPDEFIPERWTSRSELVLNRSAFLPFLIGPNNCPGKPLAMMELRSVVARTLNDFDVLFPEGVKFDEVKFFKGVKDHFVAGVPKQDLVFTARKPEG